MNEAVVKVMTALATQPDKEMTAVEIRRLGHLSADDIWPALLEATRFGWVVGRWEESKTARYGPRLYQLTDDGKRRAHELGAPYPPPGRPGSFRAAGNVSPSDLRCWPTGGR